MGFQMLFQMVWMRGGIVTLVTFILFLTGVNSQMLPQIVCLRECMVTLFAFVRPFPTVYNQVSLQMAFGVGRIFTQIAPKRPLSLVCFQMPPQITYFCE